MKRILLALATTVPLLTSAQLNPVEIALNNWATGLTRPVWLTHAGDDRLFVVERGGIIKIIADSMQVLPTPFLNITPQVNSVQGEQGLLGLAFDPDYAANGYFYVNYIHGSGSGTSRISRFQVSTDPNVADPTTEVVLYTVQQPYVNHNGGCLQFGPDGYLYCGFGDGGSGNDPDQNGQDFTTPLGKMIRIDIAQHDSTFAIPSDNPFVAAQDTLPEIWAGGLRNPWRFSFDRLTGDLWMGDVGQNAWEEMNYWPAGDNSGPNFGWRCREGLVPTPSVNQAGCTEQGPFVDPVAVFGHTTTGWCSVIGGYVYRGSNFPRLYGKYIFTDFCTNDFITFGDGYSLDTLLSATGNGTSAIGEGLAGELFVVNHGNGTVKKIVDACPMPAPEISYDGTTLTSTVADGWQWFLNGTAIPGATGVSYTPVENGSYQVRADLGSSCLLLSAPVEVTNTSIREHAGFHPAIVPQPAKETVELRADGSAKPAYAVELVDVLGQVHRAIQWPAHQSTLRIDLRGLAAGSYVVRGKAEGDRNWARTLIVAD